MYGNDLSSSISLKVPSGEIWKVEIVKDDGQIWLQSGWQDFVEYYSIGHGSFLVFEYEHCNSSFNVIIFDQSATEIDYPFSFINGDNKKPNPEEQVQKQNVEEPEILRHFSPSRKTKQVQSSQPNKKMKLENDIRNTVHVEVATDSEANSCRGGLPGEKQTTTGRKTLTFLEKSNAIDRASTKFKSQNPFFMIVLQPSYVEKRGKEVGIPTNFARKYLNNNNGDAILNSVDGRIWSIKYLTYKTPGRVRTLITSRGWKKFVGDNHLEVGDVCAFELIDPQKTIFKVSIYKDTKAPNLFLSFGNSNRSIDKESSSSNRLRKPSFSNPSKAVESAEKSTSANPIFDAVITPSYQQHGPVQLPREFTKNNGLRTGMAKLQVNNKWWPVKLIKNPDTGKSKLSGGWHAFARENSLQVGDVCNFELSSSENLLIKVSIFRRKSS